MPRTRHSRRTASRTPTPSIPLNIPGAVPNIDLSRFRWVKRAFPSYHHLPHPPTSIYTDGSLADRVGWTLLHPDLRSITNTILIRYRSETVISADNYRGAADTLASLHLMRRFVALNPGEDQCLYHDTLAAIDSAIHWNYRIVDCCCAGSDQAG